MSRLRMVVPKTLRTLRVGLGRAPCQCSSDRPERAADGGCARSVHAEANCIAFAARHGIDTEGATLYSTHLPCLKCAELIVNAGIVGVYYDMDYRIKDGEILLQRAGVDIIKL